MDTKAHQSASREIKKYLLSIVRNDWEWPPPSPPASSDAPPEVASHALRNREPTVYKERYYGTTDESEEEEEQEEEEARSGEEDGPKEFKFENPDAIGGMIERRIAKRKRRRKDRLEEEMSWNEGLRCFVERRNGWTGARRRSDVPSAHSATGGHKEGAKADEAELPGGSVDRELNGHKEEELPETDPLLPIPPPLIDPSNPLRAAIDPRHYSDIYTKIVHSSRTPTTPINLVDMTRSLVQGWKENGEWPPKVAAIEPAIAGRRLKKSQNGRDLGLEVAMGLHNGEMKDGEEGAHGIGLGEGILAHHPHFKKGVEGVKRVLRLSGSHTSHGSHHAGAEDGVV
ncbi:hypothetical protein NA57DRAFT_77983 [Rhizodiscina lignyota]|uniref:Gag1-like clamp domain-containing protein n=1 Tax=Rhizodiscina lignyota TaxID=1504668 RepID=A0A9P4ID65_9PEZI|nr:hypothetical protein NA57DRAFT_77983 [Rhizodiscina lignyota]